MKVVKDLIGGSKPQPIELLYNGTLDDDSTTLRYKGSLVKVMDVDDVDVGKFCTFAGLATAMENIIGILAEDQPTSGNYVPNDAAYGPTYKKIVPIFPSTIIEAEYSQKDSAGADNTDTGASASAASSTFTCASLTSNDTWIGGWIYFVTGSAAGELHYVLDNEASGNTMTFATAMTNAAIAGDTFLAIRPPMTVVVDFDGTYSDLKSEVTDSSAVDVITGLSTWISAPGIGKTKLSRDTHDGLKISNAKFYHQFTLPGNRDVPNAWLGIKEG